MKEAEEMHSAAERRFAALGRQPLRKVAPDTSFVAGAPGSLRDIWNHRELWWLLTKREVKARYKDSAGGFIWTLIRPLVALLIYYFIVGKILGAERGIDDFAIYLFAGLTIWTLFSSIVSSCTSSIIANSGIVKKIYLPREIFPLSAAGSAFVDFLAQFVILFVAGLVVRGMNWLHLLVYGPISVFMMVVWGVALGLLLSAANVYLRDIQYLVEVVLSIGMWMTPSLYSFGMVLDKAPAWLAELYLWNPAAIGVIGFQQATWTIGDISPKAVWPDHLLIRMLIMTVIGLVLLFINQRWFARLQRNFAQEI